jgi:hypothetical protein
VFFRRGRVVKRFGDTEFLTDFTEDLEVIDQLFLFDGTSHLVFATRTELARYNTTTGAKVTLNSSLAGSSTRKWHSDFWNNKIYFTNHALGLYSWDGAAGSATLEVSDPKGGNIAPFEDHIFLIDIEEGGTVKPQDIAWSDNGDPTNFTVGGASSAGRLSLSDDASFGLLFTQLGPFFFAIKERAIYNIQKIGGDFIFARRIVVDGIGPISSNVVVNLGDRILFWGVDDFYEFDGVNLRSLGPDLTVRKFVFADLHPNFRNSANALFIEEDSEIWWFYVSASSTTGFVDKAVVFNIEDEAFSLHTIDVTAGGYFQEIAATLSDDVLTLSDDDETESDVIARLTNFPLNLIARPGGNIYTLGTSNQDGLGEPIDGFSEIIFVPFEEGTICVWTLIRLSFERRFGPVNVLIHYLGVLTPLAEIEFVDSKSFVLNTEDSYTMEKEILESGRYLALRVRTSEVNSRWSLTRMEIEYDLAGEV